MKTVSLYGSTAERTGITTTVRRSTPFGSRGHYEATARLWRVTGRHAKEPGQSPFLTSAAEAREWIRDQVANDGPRAEEYEAREAAEDAAGVKLIRSIIRPRK